MLQSHKIEAKTYKEQNKRNRKNYSWKYCFPQKVAQVNILCNTKRGFKKSEKKAEGGQSP